MVRTESLHFIKEAAKAADEKLGKGIVALNVKGISSVTDYFLFIGGTSHIHVRALEDAVRNQLQRAGAQIMGLDGKRGHGWRVLDYGSVIIHVMEQNMRDYYGVERLWLQGKKLKLTRPQPKKTLKKRKSKKSKKKK